MSRHPRKSPLSTLLQYTTHPKSKMLPNSRTSRGRGGGKGKILGIGTSYEAHHPAQPTSITTSLGTAGLLLLILLHIPLLLFSLEGQRSVRIRVLREFRVVPATVPKFFHIPNSHVHDVIWGKPPHDELPCRRGDACYARLARCVEGDAFAPNAP